MKKCVFCGKEITNKTKVHILPKWLIKFTGDENRCINLGYKYWDNIDQMIIPFSSLTMPACKKCNYNDSTLENQSKNIIEGIVKYNILNYSDINILLDFFDKLRIGMWLYFNSLSKNFSDIVPHFSINNRMHKFDRVLAIYRTNENVGMNFIGTNTIAYQHCPSVALFRINNYRFLSYSSQFLLSHRCGLPYPNSNNIVINNKDVLGIELLPGENKIKIPFLRRRMTRNGVEIYQPIIPNFLSNEIKNKYYDNSYIKKNIDSDTKQIKPFICVDNNYINATEKIEFKNIIKKYSIEYNDMIINVFKYQIDEINRTSSLDETIKGIEKRIIKEKTKIAIDFNKKIIDKILSQNNIMF